MHKSHFIVARTNITKLQEAIQPKSNGRTCKSRETVQIQFLGMLQEM